MISRSHVLGGTLIAALVLLVGALFVPRVVPGFAGAVQGGVDRTEAASPVGLDPGDDPVAEGLEGRASPDAVPPVRSSSDPDWLEVEVATVGVDLLTQAPLALLREGWDEVLPIWIGQVEAEAILWALQGLDLPRPMTHDLMVSLIGGMGAELAEVRVHSLRDETYIGSLHIRVPGSDETIEIDTRPSDGLALAVRTGARVRVSRDLLEGLPEVDFVSWEQDRQLVRIRGVTTESVRAEQRDQFGLPDRPGMVVLHSTAASAPRAVRAGDLIVEVQGRPVEGIADYLSAIRAASPTAPVPVTVVRGGEEMPAALPPRSGTGRVG
jgi:uncharacterized protein